MSAGNTAIVDPQKQNGQLKEQPLTLPPREIRVVHDDSANSFLMDTAKFEHLQRIANVMANCALIPEHLLGRVKKGQPTEMYPHAQVIGNCFLITNQALRWGFDPFAVAAETYVVSGKLGFQGKLIAALVNTRANLRTRLKYAFNDGKGDALEVTIIGHFADEDEPRTVTLSVGQAKTSNDIWRSDPHQKLIYSGSIKFARRHCPEIILGVFTDDDLDRMRDSQKSIESESTNSLSKLIGSGALKGDTPIPEEVDRRTLPKTRRKKDVAETASVETTPQPSKEEEQSHYEEYPKDTTPTPPLPTRLDECEAYAKKEGLSCVAADPEGTYAEYRLGNGKTIAFTTKSTASSESRYCVLMSDEDATQQMVDIINYAKSQVEKRA